MRFAVLKSSFENTGALHHAMLLSTLYADVREELLDFLEKEMAFNTTNNPDFHVHEYDSLGIDDTRSLQRVAAQKPLGERKIFVFSFARITTEAQNALLKLFEEPTSNTHFFVFTKASEQLLPTLRSRLFIIEEGIRELEKNDEKNAIAFLKKSKSERLKDLKDLLDTKDKQRFVEFLSSLEHVLYEKLKAKKQDVEVQRGLKEVLRSKQYILDRASSAKLLLEHVALSVPKL